MSAAPYFDSGGFNRDQNNNIGVVLHDLDGQPYVASGGTGGGGGVVQLQVRDTGLGAWVNLEGTAARGVEVDPITGSADAAVGLPARVDVIGGYDGANVRAVKTSAAGVLQVDVLSGAGSATLAEQQTQTTRLTEIRDRLPDNPISTAPAATDEGLIVHVATMPGGGGGTNTEYTEGATDATITGIAFLWEDASDTLRAVSAAKPLPVALQGTPSVTATVTDILGGTVSVDNFPATQPVSGSVTADTEVTTGDLDTGAGTDTRAVVGLVRAESGGGLLVGSANPLPVTLSTLPAGTNNIGDVDLASAIPTGDNVIGRVKITDGTDMAEVVTASGASSPPAAGTAGIVAHIASMPAAGGGAGTEYTEGDVDASITGPALLWEDASDTLRAVSAAKPLPVAQQGNVTIQDGGGSITVDGSVAVSGAVDTELPAPAALADNTANPTVPGVGSFNMVWDGATWDREPATRNVTIASALPAGTANIGDVDVLTVPADPFGVNADAAATAGSTGSMQAKFRLMTSQLDSIKTAVETLDNTVAGSELQVDVLTLPSISLAGSTNNIGDVDVLTLPGVAGDVAHDAADSGNPQKMGFRAESTDITAVADGDRTDGIATLLGKQIVMPYANPGREQKGSANSTGTGDTSVIAAPGAGLRLYITTLIVTNAHATVGTKVQIKSGTTTTGYPRLQAAAAGGGASITFPTPLRLGVNEALQFANVTTGADVDVSAVGYIAAE